MLDGLSKYIKELKNRLFDYSGISTFKAKLVSLKIEG